jgi:hypothetical protein
MIPGLLKRKCPKKFWNIFIISIHGIVYFHKNTKQIFVEFPVKDAITLKQYQQFFLECIVLIIIDDVNVEVISNVSVLFSNEMDGLGSSFLLQNSLCMLIALNKSSHNTVMRERVLDIVLLKYVSLEFATSTLIASQKHNLSIFGWFLAKFQILHPVQTFLKRF